MTTTNTPRTDAFFNRTDIEWDDAVLFARQLDEIDVERRQWLENREKSTFQNWIDRAEKAEAEVEKLKELVAWYESRHSTIIST